MRSKEPKQPASFRKLWKKHSIVGAEPSIEASLALPLESVEAPDGHQFAGPKMAALVFLHVFDRLVDPAKRFS
jgi:hypothetical protein